MPSVALFSTYFLQYSQTFVYDEITRHERYAVEVFCRKRLNGDRFAFEPVHVANPLYEFTRRDSRFDALFRERRYALVHAHFGPGGIYAMGFARRFRLPLVVTFHGYDVPLLESPRRFLPKYIRYAFFGPRLLDTMTLGLCASKELLGMLRRQGVPESRLRLHHIGIDLERFQGKPRPPNESTRIVMIGRFVEKKGFEYGIRAFAQATKGTDATLTLVGDGELRPRLEAVVTELGIDQRVRFLGSIPSSTVANELRSSHVLLAPSVVAKAGDRESGLLSVKEASASGVVPIGTRHGGIPEIIEDGVTGFLVPERDVAALAARLTELLRNPSLRLRMARAGRDKMIREYDCRARVRALEDRYDEAVRAHVRGGGR